MSVFSYANKASTLSQKNKGNNNSFVSVFCKMFHSKLRALYLHVVNKSLDLPSGGPKFNSILHAS